ncbi:hypothetical protein B5X24_HaOG208492 [Helicoverpa armigera]|uniref:Peptidase aspartic putative domain-containing protein n=1 Tax=Helicoverpa armigera TaxID=29058 RepID=A0A2W1BM68_HELAM|nr:hypothetical protein B5X24_HaOG208492 [Helicoverpa armigera]
MELIEKKLAADLAKLDSCGSQSLADGEPGEEENASRIEEWVKTQRVTSCHDDALRPAQRQDAVLQQLDNAGPSQLGNVQPNQNGTDDGTMHMQSACVLKDLAAATATTNANQAETKLLNQLSMPKDLPKFDGDPLDWLQFKQAYEESSQVSKFNDRENLCDVTACEQPHHRLPHYVPTAAAEVVAAPSTATQSSSVTEVVTHVNTNHNEWSVQLKVVPVLIHGPMGAFSASALPDDGFNVSMISASLAARAGLRGRTQTMRVRGAWDKNELMCAAELVDLIVSNKLGEKFNISARSVNELSLPEQGSLNFKCETYDHLRDIKDDLCFASLKPDLLIGQDNYHLLFPLETLVGKPGEPCATLIPLGWCLHGRVPGTQTEHTTLCMSVVATANVSATAELHDDVRRSFTLEPMGASPAKHQLSANDLVDPTSATSSATTVADNTSATPLSTTSLKQTIMKPTKLNIADIATRESYDCSVLQDEWLQGPTFLYKHPEYWPLDVVEPANKELLECVTAIDNTIETFRLLFSVF